MTTAKRPKLPSFTTPALTFKFPKLTEPDFKFKTQGEFSVKGIGKLAQLQALINKIKPLWEAAIAEGEEAYKALPVATRKKMEAKGQGFTANPFYSPVYDDNEEETDEVELKFGMNYSGEYKSGPKAGQKWTRQPALFDAKGRPLSKNTQIWGGTVGKVSFEVSPYWIPAQGAAGVSLRLQAVQIIDLVSGGQRNANAYGFGEEEGYEQSDDVDNTSDDTSDNTEQSDTGASDDDF